MITAGLIVLMAQGQPLAVSGWKAEVIQPYRDCLIAAYKEATLLGGGAGQAITKAKSSCGNSRSVAQLSVKAHYLLSVRDPDNDEVLKSAFDRLSDAEQRRLIDKVSSEEFDYLEFQLEREISRID
ncbi:MAG: hypothetical protein JSS55_14825 [Proteobacteria bacterium]|nr:hypothetical protein [Pseudomonadota bacterium]